MRMVRRIIKYVTMAFAIYLAINIITGITSFGSIFNFKKGNIEVKEDNKLYDNMSSSYLIVDLLSSDLVITPGDKLSIEGDKEYLTIKNDDGKIIVKEKKRSISNIKPSKVTITVPSDFVFDEIDISTTAGKANISGITSNEADINLGAGAIKISDMKVLSKIELNTGAGSVNIDNCSFTNLSLESSVGSVYFKGSILGDSSIETGVGKVEINLAIDNNDYKFDVDKGIGSVIINDTEMKKEDSYVQENGTNSIDISSGIADVDVKFYTSNGI